MRTFLALSVIFLGLSGAAAVTHSLQYFYTGSSGISGFPEFLTVGMVDGQPFTYYDSNIKKVIPKQDWMAKNEGPEYWDSQTRKSIDAEQVFKANIDTAKHRFNQTGGFHIFQRMCGCEWNEETNEVNGYEQCGYDGEDFITFQVKTETWIAPKQQAVMTKHKLDRDKAFSAIMKNYYTHDCPDWLKKYLNFGRSSLMRTVLPSVSLLQKTPASPITCHATGFYPDRADLVWRKDGEEIHEGVEKGEILTNNDGTFQMSADLDLRSVPAENWRRYDCLFQLSGVNRDIVTKLDKAVIRTNEASAADPISPIILIAIAAVLVFIALIGFIIYKKKSDKKTPPKNDPRRPRSSSDSTSSSDSASSTDSVTSTTQLIQKKETV